MKRVFGHITSFRELGILLVFVVLYIGVGLMNNVFFSLSNIQNMTRAASYTIIIALPMMICLITGGIDLSVGSVLGLGGIISAYCLVDLGMSLVISIIIALLVGLLYGYMNGLIVVKLNVPPFIATLGTLYIARGIINVLTQATPIFPLPESFKIIGTGELFGFSYSVCMALALAIIVHLLMRLTKYGRYVYAVGGNAEVARLAGVKVKSIKISAYMATALGATISGIFVAARIGSAQVAAGEGWELDVIAACVLGGVSTLGGEGSVLGTVIGAMLMVIMQTGMVMLRVSAYWQNIVVGVVIIAIVALDQYKRLRSI